MIPVDSTRQPDRSSLVGNLTRESDLDDMRMHVKIKLSLLWTALMFFYIYGDYFGLYVPGQLKGMLEGEGPIGPVRQRESRDRFDFDRAPGTDGSKAL